MFTNPDENVSKLHVEKDHFVAVFGSGAGGHSFAAARVLKALKGKGAVYAIDIRKNMIERIQNDAEAEGLDNIKAVWCDCEEQNGTKLSDKSVNFVIIPNTLFAYDNRVGVLEEAFRITMPKGKLMIIEWKASFNGLGPQQENLVSEQQATDWAVNAGFKHESSFQAGTQHYGLIFSKP